MRAAMMVENCSTEAWGRMLDDLTRVQTTLRLAQAIELEAVGRSEKAFDLDGYQVRLMLETADEALRRALSVLCEAEPAGGAS